MYYVYLDIEHDKYYITNHKQKETEDIIIEIFDTFKEAQTYRKYLKRFKRKMDFDDIA